MNGGRPWPVNGLRRQDPSQSLRREPGPGELASRWAPHSAQTRHFGVADPGAVRVTLGSCSARVGRRGVTRRTAQLGLGAGTGRRTGSRRVAVGYRRIRGRSSSTHLRDVAVCASSVTAPGTSWTPNTDSALPRAASGRSAAANGLRTGDNSSKRARTFPMISSAAAVVGSLGVVTANCRFNRACSAYLTVSFGILVPLPVLGTAPPSRVAATG